MDFFDNVVNKSNAIIKERLNNPFGSKQSQESQETATVGETTSSGQDEAGNNTPYLESAAREHHQQLNSQDTMISNASQSNDNTNPDQNNAGGDKNSQFAAIAADAEAVAQKAAKGAKNIGTFLFSMANKAGQTVSQTAKQVKQAVESTSILTDFTREQQDFIKEHGGTLQAGQLPWDLSSSAEGGGAGPEFDESRAAYIKEQILSLSQDKRNFVRSPPSDADFKFDPQSCYPIALSLLKEDPNLNKLRYELVPKLVNEDTFWCNYFYRVSMLKQMSEKGASAKQGWSSSRSSSGEGPDEVSSMTPHGTIDEPSSPGYMTSDHKTATTTPQRPTPPAVATAQKQDSFKLDSSTSLERQQSTTTTTQQQQQQPEQQQYQAQELESSETRKLFAEADDLKSKLRELNIGSLDGNDDEWDEELQQDLQEFELVSGGDLDGALDEEFLQSDIMQQQQQQQQPQQQQQQTAEAVDKQDKKTS